MPNAPENILHCLELKLKAAYLQMSQNISRKSTLGKM
jgi:hypothetical protein